MKKNKGLYRAWFWSYVTLLFGAAVSALLGSRFSGALAIILTVLAFIDLGFIIAAQVLYIKKRSLFPVFGLVAQGLNTLLILLGFIFESVLTAQGFPAVYAWFVSPICLFLTIFIDWTTIKYVLKIIRGEKIIEGKQ